MSNEYLKYGIALLVGLVVGLGFSSVQPHNTLGGQTGSDFATRGNLSASGTLTVAGAVSFQSAVLNSGAVSIGGTSANNTINYYWTVTSTAMNGTTTAVVLAVFPSTTSTASTTIDITGLTAGT